MADTPALGAGGAIRAGSSPAPGTKLFPMNDFPQKISEAAFAKSNLVGSPDYLRLDDASRPPAVRSVSELFDLYLAFATKFEAVVNHELKTRFQNAVLRAYRSGMFRVPLPGNKPGTRALTMTEIFHGMETLAGRRFTRQDELDKHRAKLAEYCASIDAVNGAIDQSVRSMIVGVPAPEHFIGLNDYVDAKHKIDFVDIAYDLRGGRVTPVRVRLAQVKTSQHNPRVRGSDSPEDIGLAHGSFVDRLLSPTEAIPLAHHADAIRHARRVDYLAEAREIPTTDRAARLQAVSNLLWPFLGQFVTDAAGTRYMESGKIDAILRARLPNVKSCYVRALFSGDRQWELFRQIMELNGHPDDVARVFDNLRSWAAQRPLSAEEVVSLHPEWSSAGVFGMTEFVSTYYHGRNKDEVAIATGPKQGSKRPRGLTIG